MDELREKEIAQFLLNYAMGAYNTENLNLQEQMEFKARHIMSLIKPEKPKVKLRNLTDEEINEALWQSHLRLIDRYSAILKAHRDKIKKDNENSGVEFEEE